MLNQKLKSFRDISEISLKYKSAFVSSKNKETTRQSEDIAFTLNAEMMNLGYIQSRDLNKHISKLPRSMAQKVSHYFLNALRKHSGVNVKHSPMYPNFPEQVINSSDLDIYINAVVHYWTMGEWRPNYEELPRKFSYEETNYKVINIINEEEFKSIFTDIMSVNDSISNFDKETIETMLTLYDISDLELPSEIPYKENLGFLYKAYGDMEIVMSAVSHATDILRIVAYASDGDMSLSEPIKFKSFKRKDRRAILRKLENIVNEEDINRHRSHWTKLFHILHIGDFSNKFPKTYKIARKIRNNEKIKTFNSKLEDSLKDLKNETDKKSFNNILSYTLNYLKSRPGEFCRRLYEISTINEKFSKSPQAILKINKEFSEIVDEISTRVLLQTENVINNRVRGDLNRLAFPKGNIQKVMKPSPARPISENLGKSLLNTIEESLIRRFKNSDWGNIWVSKQANTFAQGLTLPSQQRTTSNTNFSIGRGSRISINPNKSTVRMFVYWRGVDIDLSAILLDENFDYLKHISYTEIRNNLGHHSGDITYAPSGASEFIDIDIDKAKMTYKDARYIAMSLYVYSGPNFFNHEECFAGWMERSNPNSNEIYEPKSVKQKMDLTYMSRDACPVIFDLKNKEFIWVDLPLKLDNPGVRLHNIENSMVSISEIVRNIVNYTPPNLGRILDLHLKAKSENIVESKDDADTVITQDELTNPIWINSKLIK